MASPGCCGYRPRGKLTPSSSTESWPRGATPVVEEPCYDERKQPNWNVRRNEEANQSDATQSWAVEEAEKRRKPPTRERPKVATSTNVRAAAPTDPKDKGFRRLALPGRSWAPARAALHPAREDGAGRRRAQMGGRAAPQQRETSRMPPREPLVTSTQDAGGPRRLKRQANRATKQAEAKQRSAALARGSTWRRERGKSSPPAARGRSA